MALTGWSSGTPNYLRRTSAVIGDAPWMISAWVNNPSFAANQFICSVGTLGSGDHFRRIQSTSAGAVGASTRDATVADTAASTANSTINTWHHFFGEFISDTSRAALLNGANRGTNGTSINPNNSDSVHIGVESAVTNNYNSSGGIAEVSIWDGAGMTTGNMDSLSVKLAAGENPINIDAEAAQPWTGKLVAYWPLTNTTDLTDASGNGHDLTMIGTLTNFASHPTIDAVESGATLMGAICM